MQVHSYMIWLRRIFFFVLVIYLVILATAFLMQRKLIYFPNGFYAPPPPYMTEVIANDGSMGWHAPASEGQLTVMVFHGNASAIDSNMHIFRDLQSAGYGVWSVGYPGYPGNEGKPTQDDMISAALSQLQALQNTGAERVVLYGTSLGGGVAAQVAAQRKMELVILDAPFNSMLDMAQRTMPLVPSQLLLKDKWRSDKAMENVDIPLLWIHGTADGVIPVSQGQKLFEGYKGPKTSYIIEGAHHTNTWLLGGREIVLSQLSTL